MRINQRQLTTRLIFIGALLLLAAFLLKGWLIYRAASNLLARPTEAEALLVNGFSSVDAAAAENLIFGLRQDVVVLKQETAVFLPLTPYLGWLPRIGPLIAQAEPLLAMADAGTETAAYAFRGLKPGLAIMQDNSLGGMDKMAGLVAVLDTARPDLAAAAAAFEHYTTARGRLANLEALPWRVRSLLAQADAYENLVQDGLQVAQILPAFLGINGPRRYLLLAQNEEELRPTGGFIAGAGVLTVQNGRLHDMLFFDANYADDFLNKPYPFPPQPLYDFMGLELFLLRDANFWPDFPTSAQMAMDLYSYGQDLPPLDGAIAFDQQFMRLFVEALGEVFIPEEAVTINSRNVIAAMQEAWSYDEEQDVGQWVRDRKSFLGTFAGAIMAKVQSDFGSIDPLLLLKNVGTAVQTRRLQLYSRDPAVAAVLDAVNWDGRYENITGQDVLGVVDTNVGYNKVNSLIQREIRYEVNLDSLQARLDLTYHHTGTPENEPCYQGTPYTGGISYTERLNTCYWNYLRIYTPDGVRLLNASQHEIPGETMFSGRDWREVAQIIDEPVVLTVIANAFLLPWAQTLTSSYTYQLPAGVVNTVNGQRQYQLVVYKQAGTPAQPLEVVVQLPSGAALISAHPKPTAVSGATIIFSVDLDSNQHLHLTYRH